MSIPSTENNAFLREFNERKIAAKLHCDAQALHLSILLDALESELKFEIEVDQSKFDESSKQAQNEKIQTLRNSIEELRVCESGYKFAKEYISAMNSDVSIDTGTSVTPAVVAAGFDFQVLSGLKKIPDFKKQPLVTRAKNFISQRPNTLRALFLVLLYSSLVIAGCSISGGALLPVFVGIAACLMPCIFFCRKQEATQNRAKARSENTNKVIAQKQILQKAVKNIEPVASSSGEEVRGVPIVSPPSLPPCTGTIFGYMGKRTIRKLNKSRESGSVDCLTRVRNSHPQLQPTL